MADVISIRKEVTALERLEQLQRITVACYAAAIRSAAEYAVEVEPAHAESLRQNLASLDPLLETASQAGDFEAVQYSFRGELRDYRNKAQEALQRMRADLKSAAVAMQALAEDIASNTNDHDKQLCDDLNKLKRAAHQDDLARLRAVIDEVTASIQHSISCMNQANQLVIAQLNDEIRSLHRERDNERRVLQTDRASGAWNRDRIADRIEDLMRDNQGFSVLLTKVSNLRRLEHTLPAGVPDSVLKALVKRTLGVVGATALAGRWSADEFAVILETETLPPVAVCAQLCRALSTRYAVEQDGKTQYLELNIASGVVDFVAGASQRRFREQLEQLSLGLRAV